MWEPKSSVGNSFLKFRGGGGGSVVLTFPVTRVGGRVGRKGFGSGEWRLAIRSLQNR